MWDVEDPTRGAMAGKDAHAGVFEPGSTAWINIRAVIAGQDVTLYTPPFEATTPQGIPIAVRYPMEDPDFEPPTASVP
jgi:hypothetical protein